MNDVAIVGTGQTKFSKDDGDVEKTYANTENLEKCYGSLRFCRPISLLLESIMLSGPSLGLI